VKLKVNAMAWLVPATRMLSGLNELINQTATLVRRKAIQWIGNCIFALPDAQIEQSFGAFLS
jgi:hypothetical protein